MLDVHYVSGVGTKYVSMTTMKLKTGVAPTYETSCFFKYINGKCPKICSYKDVARVIYNITLLKRKCVFACTLILA
jgi:hypothetical protein